MKSLYANLGHHDAIDHYDANVLTEIEHEVQISKVNIQHWTLRQEQIVIQVLYVWHAGM